MNTIWFWLLFLQFSFTEQTTMQRDVCPPRFVTDNRSSTGRSCHEHTESAIKCSPEFPLLLFGNCLTHKSATEYTEFGPCPYIAHHKPTCIQHVFYIQLPSDVSLLTQFMCGPLNQEGTLRV